MITIYKKAYMHTSFLCPYQNYSFPHKHFSKVTKFSPTHVQMSNEAPLVLFERSLGSTKSPTFYYPTLIISFSSTLFPMV